MEMKSCPVCSTKNFEDMEVCYSCLHRFNVNTEYVICYYDDLGNRTWAYADGEDAVNRRVDELVEHRGCHVDEIKVFKASNDLNLTD